MDQEQSRDILSVLKDSLKILENDPRPDTPAVAELRRILAGRIEKLEHAKRSIFGRKPR
ncbi:MAG TPA: hypothetical protein VGI45_17010 [Terracidiphilus sp.]|jgi:hypothetical protein